MNDFRFKAGEVFGSGSRASLAVACALTFAVLVALDSQAQPAYDAAFVSQSAPPFVQLQTPAPASITMRNTGTATWVRAEGDVFLSTQEPQDNYYWCIQDNRYGSQSGNRVLLPYDVAPGQNVTFDFVVKPLGCGFTATAPFRFRMLSHLHGTFGEETPDPQLVVTTAAEFVAQQVPSTVPAGVTIPVTVTFENTSNVTWQPADGYVLNSAAPTGNATWGVSAVPLPAAVAPGDSVTFEFSVVTPSRVGRYNFQWQMNLPEGVPFGLSSPATAVQVVAPGQPNYQGLWWASPPGSEAGWGLSLAHQGGIIFATWFTYDSAGNPWWLTMTALLANTGTPSVYQGTLFQMTGPPFFSVPFDPTLVRSLAVGTGTLTFTDDDNGIFAYVVNNVAQTKRITREVFGPLPTCTFAIVPDPREAYNYQDLWWAAPAGSESGWGIYFSHQGDVIFATWFTYDVDRSPLWLVATAPKTAPGVYSGTLYRTTGPPVSAVPFLPGRVVATPAGTATFTFADGNHATFAYTLNGVSRTEAITRQVFQSPGTVCQ